MKNRELLEKENLCIEEHAPWCTAECPMHLDARALMALIREGDFDTAHSILRKSLLFPNIVSKQCLAPCEKKCKRTEAGEGIAIHQIEQAVTAYGQSEPLDITPRMKMKKRVALVGSNISAMAVAAVLLEKGYPVTLFGYEENEEIRKEDEDFSFLFQCDLAIDETYRPLQLMNEALIREISAYDCVYFANLTEEAFRTQYEGTWKTIAGWEAEKEGDLPKKLFFSMEMDLIIRQISSGKQIATSMDRVLKGVSVSAGRKAEDSYESQLFTSIEGIEPSNRIPLTDSKTEIYTREEAIKEAKRCIGCRCMECVKECRFLQKYEKYPKKYVREIFNNISTGGIGFRKGKPMINTCSMCGLCKEICVNSIPMGEICKAAREALVKIDAMPPRYYDFPLRDMMFSNSEQSSFFRHQPGSEQSKYLFFPGCQMAAMRSENVESMYEYLMTHLEGGVGLMLGCCGAPAAWAGRQDLYGEVMTAFRTAWEGAAQPTILTACPTCYREFREALPQAKVETIWNIYNRYPLPELSEEDGSKPVDKVLAIHDPCTARYEEEMQQDIRSILEKRGYEIEELPFSKNKTRCCGYGGLMFYADAELTREINRERLKESDKAYMTYCAVCRDFLADGEKPVFHILDALYGQMTPEEGRRKGKNISEKVADRINLKKQLLKKFWGEDVTMEQKEWNTLELIIPEEVKSLMEDRLILEENVRQVIWEAEQTGAKIVDPNTNHFLASSRPGIVTYWVEYEQSGGIFYVHRAYSHRIMIMED